jgi:hypothetical protein
VGYELRNCWSKEDKGLLNFNHVETSLAGELGPLQASARMTSILLGTPRKITRCVRLHMPCRWGGTGWSYEGEAPGLRFDERVDISGRMITSSKELVINASSLYAKDAGTYSEIAARLRKNVLMIPARLRFGKLRPIVSSGSLSIYNMWLIFGALMIIFMLARAIALLGHHPAQKSVEPTRPNSTKTWQPPAGTVWPSPNGSTAPPR